jgi:tyrosine-protein kinase Etk/Wzc
MKNIVDSTLNSLSFPQQKKQIKPLESHSKDFFYYYSLFLNNWYWLFLGLLIGVSLFYFKMRYAKTVYQIGGSVMIEDVGRTAISKEAIARDLGFVDKGESSMEDRIRILTSPELMLRVVDSLSLNITYIQEGRVKKSEYYNNSPVRLLYWNTEGAEKSFQIRIKHYDALHFVLFRTEDQTEVLSYGTPFKHGQRELVLKKIGFISPENPILITVSDLYATADLHRSHLSIVPEGRSNVLNINTIDELPERGIAIINRLIHEYGVYMVENKNDIGRRTMDFITQRLNYVANELYSVEKQEEGFKRDRSLPLTNPQITKSYIDKSESIQQKVEALNIRLAEVTNIETIVVDKTTAFRPLPFSAEVSASAPLTSLIRNYNDLIAKRSQLKESGTDDNPAVVSYIEAMKVMKNDILVTIQTIKEEVNNQKERYKQQIIPLENQINMMPTNDRELAQIMREKSIRETLFLFLLQKREETALSVAAQADNSHLLERAKAKGIISPKPLQMGLFYTLLGLVLPILGLYVKDMFNDKIHHRADIDKHLSLPFVGFIPHIRGKRNKLIINDSHSILAESFRLVRSNLHNNADNQQSKTILISSAISGEGKTFVAANLALTLGLTGKKGIVLGLDLRRPQLEAFLADKVTEKGIAQFLSGKEKSLQKLIQVCAELPNLHYIDCGTIPKNPSELMMTDKLNQLFDYCDKNYDFVVVDGAPVGVVADSFLLKDFAGQTLIVLQYGYSNTSHLKFLSEVNENNKLNNMNILLNNVKQELGNSYNYGYFSSNYYYKEKDSFWYKTKTFLKLKSKNLRA